MKVTVGQVVEANNEVGKEEKNVVKAKRRKGSGLVQSRLSETGGEADVQ